MGRRDPSAQREQLIMQRRKVDFDSYDITVDELVRRVSSRRIEIAPSYQRQFRWDNARQSRLIESLLLGVPVPPLFMATNVKADEAMTTWEVVDGLQRLLTLTNFLGNSLTREVARLRSQPLELSGLEILTLFEGESAARLPGDIVSGLLDRPVKVIVLNDKSDLQVRFDLFERLNTGGVRLTDQEVREAVYMGPFVDMLSELSQSSHFASVVQLPKQRTIDGTPQDYVLRFFAFRDGYERFNHSVRDFLNSYCAQHAADSGLEHRRLEFTTTFEFLTHAFPQGIRRRNAGTTPVNLYEAVSVGAALALALEPDLPAGPQSWLDDAELKELTTGATNDRRRVTGRIEYARDRFLQSA